MNEYKHTWKVQLMDTESGATSEALFTCGWDPNKEQVTDTLIAQSCAAQEGYPRKRKLAGISAVLQA